MPRITKAALQDANESLRNTNRGLREENEKLKTRISRGHDRSRSPRMPAANSQASVETTCKALNQVKQWQRDIVVEEQQAEIQRLRAELAQKNEQIAGLRRGEGPVGEVLMHAYRTKVERYGVAPGELTLREMSARTGPVFEHFITLGDVLKDVEDFARMGRCYTRPTQMPY
jgi:cell division protein FtsB